QGCSGAGLQACERGADQPPPRLRRSAEASAKAAAPRDALWERRWRRACPSRAPAPRSLRMLQSLVDFIKTSLHPSSIFMYLLLVMVGVLLLYLRSGAKVARRW